MTLDEEGPELLGVLLEAAEIVEKVEMGLREVLGALPEVTLDEEDPILDAVLAAALDEEDPVLDAVLEVALDEEDPELPGVLLEAAEDVETLEIGPKGALDEMLEVLLSEEGNELLDVLLETVELTKTLDTLLEILLIKVETLELVETLDKLLVMDDDDELDVELGAGARESLDRRRIHLMLYDVDCAVLLAGIDVAMFVDVVGPGTVMTAYTSHMNLLINPKSSRRTITYSGRIPNPYSKAIAAKTRQLYSPILTNHLSHSKKKKKRAPYHAPRADSPSRALSCASKSHKSLPIGH